VEYFRGIFGTRLIFKSLEEVISSQEVSEGHIVLRIHNEVCTGIDIAF